jgi:ABC-2 type transport system ATP-binding protein
MNAVSLSSEVAPDHSETVASLQRVSKRFGSLVALQSFDLEIRRGELLALLGPNGAGKSTAIAILLGLRRPDSGTATLFGQSPRRDDARLGVGVMMQDIGLPAELSVRELIKLVSSYYARPLEVDAAVKFAGVEGIAERRYGGLSGGQKRLTQFALAICGAPRLLFLDEPTTHLDHEARTLLWERIRCLVRQGTSVVLTTHYIEEAETLADRVAVIASGRALSTGTVSEVRAVAVRQRVECVTAIPIAELRSWPEVEEVTLISDRLVATTKNAVALTQRLISTDPQLRDLEVRRATLAEALSIVTKEQRS